MQVIEDKAADPLVGLYDSGFERERLLELFVRRYTGMLKAVNALLERSINLAPGSLRVDDASVRRFILTEAATRVVRIDLATQVGLRSVIARGQQMGLSAWEIANGTADGTFPGIEGLFTETWASRAHTVARTELNYAQWAASVARFQASGLVKEVEARDGGHVTSDEACTIRNGRRYSINNPPVPLHPNCGLTLTPIVDPSVLPGMRGTGVKDFEDYEYEDWDEYEQDFNPNHDPRNGEFSDGGGSGGAGKKPKYTPKPGELDARVDVPKLKRVKGGPIFEGDPVETRTSLSKQDRGKIGENVAIAYLRQFEGQRDAKHANQVHNNFPIDVVYDHVAAEVKAGDISASRAAQHWRLTIGEPGKREKAAMRGMSKEAKAALNREKQSKILVRKYKVIDDLSKRLGRKIGARELTTIVHHDQRKVDLFAFDGFHKRITWNSQQADDGYIGTFSY